MYVTNVAPASISRKVSMAKPLWRSQNGKTIITHSEYIGAVPGSTGFSSVQYPVNPGTTTVFPWLANIAGNYDRYHWRKLQFYFVPAAATSTKGRIALSWSYDALQPLPLNSQQAFSMTPNDETSVWSDATINIPPRRHPEPLYVRQLGSSSNVEAISRTTATAFQDLKTTDMGALFVTTNLCTDSSTIGELYVHYEVELLDPTFNPNTGFGEVYNASGLTIANVFPSTSSIIGSILSASPNTNTICFLVPGTYRVSFYFGGTVLTSTCPTATALEGSVVQSGSTQVPNAATTTAVALTTIVCTANPATGVTAVGWSFASSATTITSCYFSAYNTGNFVPV